MSPTNVEILLASTRTKFWQEDLEFLIGQRKNPQLGRMEGIDFAEQQRQRRGQKRRELRQKKMNISKDNHIQLDSSSDFAE